MRKSYELIYDDDDIIVLNKSGHVLTIPDRFDPTRKNLKTMMDNRFGDSFVVHRLDYETSGVIIFAKTETAMKSLSEQFEKRQIEKEYRAICLGPIEDEGVIESAIQESKSKKGKYVAGKVGKSSKTSFEVIERFGQFAFIKLIPYTGRTHQIRVHLKHYGAPLLTDSKYGLNNSFYLSQIKRVRLKRNEAERPLLNRSSLHSYELGFLHPRTGQKTIFNAPLHKDMKAVLNQLEKCLTK